jgi:hypothetical protein
LKYVIWKCQNVSGYCPEDKRPALRDGAPVEIVKEYDADTDITAYGVYIRWLRPNLFPEQEIDGACIGCEYCAPWAV